MPSYYTFEAPETSTRPLGNHQELAYRPAGAPRTGLPATQSLYHRCSTPRLILETDEYGYQIPRQGSGGRFFTPSPTEFASPSEQASFRPDGYDHGLSHNGYNLTPAAATYNENGLVQYQEELHDPMFDHQIRSDSAAPNPSLDSFDGHQQSAYTQSMGRTTSFGVQQPSSNPTIVPNGRHFGLSTSHDDEMWQASPRATSSSAAMSINNNVGFLPNHVLSSAPSACWSSGTNPSSFQSVGMQSSCNSEDGYLGGSGPSSYGYSNGLPTYPTGTLSVMAQTDRLTSWQQQYGGDPPAQVDCLPGQHEVGPFQSLPSQFGYDDHTQMYGPEQVPTTTPYIDAGSDRNEMLLKLREAKMSYKDIKRAFPHIFPEAESTLRGRDRACRKTKEERVRKPNWTASDKRLLREAVVAQVGESVANSICTEQELSRSIPQISWKDVGCYIRNNGGSYSFAPATAKKMYVKLYCSGSLVLAEQSSFSL